MPITFRNVNTPNFSAGNELIQSGGNRIQQSINQLGGLLHKRDRKEVADDTKSFKDRLAGTGLDDLDGIDTSNLGRVSQADAENLINTRRTNLRNQNTAEFNFGETQRKQREQPLIAKANELSAAGNVKGLTDYLTNGAGAGIQDTAELRQGAVNQQRANTKHGREEDLYSDGQELNTAVRRLQGERESAVIKRKEAFANYIGSETPFDTPDGVAPYSISENGSSIIYNPDANISEEQKVEIQAGFDQYKSNLGLLDSDTDQSKELTALARSIEATPQQEQNMLKLLESNQVKQRKLTNDSKLIYAEGERNADVVQKSLTDTETNAYTQFLDETPVNTARTPEQEQIKLGDVLGKIEQDSKAFSDDIDEDNAEVNKIRKAISTLDKEGYGKDGIPYPGWVMDEAYAKYGFSRLFQGGYLWDTVNTKDFKIELDRVMTKHLKSEDNLNKRTVRKDLHQKRLAGYGIQNLKDKSQALNKARNAQGQIQIRN